MRYLIVESPTKSKKIQSMLGNGWKVLASYGHIRDLPVHDLGVDRGTFRPEYEVPSKSRKTVAFLRKALKNADGVYLATDPDREGEAIAWHLMDELRLRQARRVKFNAITREAIERALQSPGEIDMQLVRAQEGRRILDRLYGYMVSPALSRVLNNRLSAGRVQSPALKLVVEREREIRDFRPVEHFGVRLHFVRDDAPDKAWRATWSVKDWMPDADPALCTDRKIAERIANCKSLSVIESKTSEALEKAPAPFTTSSLQQAASRQLGFSVRKTMDLAQKLFEQGHITYHRTDSKNLDAEAITAIRDWLARNGHTVPEQPNRWRSSANAQEAHEAIRPTRIEIEIAGESEDERKLYALVRTRAIACQMKPARYRRTVLVLEGTPEHEQRAAIFKAQGRTLLDPGWRLIEQGSAERDPDTDDDGDEDMNNPVPALAQGSVVSPLQAEVFSRRTRPPARYTEASLVARMERLGIGRPSTYASIIENNHRRKYWAKSKGRLVPTELGEQVVDWLDGRFRFMDLGFTRDLEQQLDDIAQGKTRLEPLLQSTWEMIERELYAAGIEANRPRREQASDNIPCPECSKPLVRRQGKKGTFWGCSGFPKCRYTAPDVEGRPGLRRGQTGNAA